MVVKFSHLGRYSNACSSFIMLYSVCEEILDSILPPTTYINIGDINKFCLRCECKFEQRNSTTQKVWLQAMLERSVKF